MVADDDPGVDADVLAEIRRMRELVAQDMHARAAPLVRDKAYVRSLAPPPVKDAGVIEVTVRSPANRYSRVTQASGFTPRPPKPRPVFQLTAKRFLLAAQESGNYERAMVALINIVIRPRIFDNYKRMRAADQYDWAPMKRSTRVRRIADHFPPDPLMDRGRGVAGLRLQTTRGSNFISTKDMVAFKGFPGTMFQHGYYHHFGYTSKVSGKVPARAAVVLDSRKDPEKVRQVVAAVIEGRLEGLGF